MPTSRCPYCAAENILGADVCQKCGADLAGLDIPEAEAGFVGRLLTDGLRQIPLADPLLVAPDTTVAAAVARMRESGHGCVLVQDGDRLAGIFTERDVITRVARGGREPADTPVSEVMTPDPVTLGPDDPPAFAIHRMVSQGFRHLPVVEGDDLLGFISVRSVLRYLHQDVLGAA